MSLNNDSAEAQHLKIKAVLKSELHIIYDQEPWKKSQ